ncbi:phage Gp37/Gp68 family protein [Aurantimonas sp. 22II-16-19i]|uniref:phage Gp37/Gp68 family protein n=1 Tax=Aurantimonas sp. 22II-16-19i TaxID=1317114 RepID=UPI0009F7ADD8|nr:phage Gp37/Gp68 family protein [Aurantimonas sp. 22II-16-19i]ORE90955.1 Gp37Gp68 family protein [Aurantimonas sp. 22II-16-19i]
MADGTRIEWTDATWNPITGCAVVSPGCTNCYAMKLAGTRLQHHPSRAGLTRPSKAGPVWTGEIRFNADWLDQPLRWRRPRMIFVCAHGDLFAEGVTDAMLDQIFAVMALCPQHVFQVLTKRPERMRDYLRIRAGDFMLHWPDAARQAGATLLDCRSVKELVFPLPNVWLGVSVEDKTRADERIPILLDTPAAIRWVSAEPLLGILSLNEIKLKSGALIDSLSSRRDGPYVASPSTLNWIIVGGESGNGARPMHPDWARSLRDQCAAAGVPFLFKQWGEWAPGENCNRRQTHTEDVATFYSEDWSNPGWHYGRIGVSASEEMHRDDEPDLWRVGKHAAGRHLDGVTHDAFPERAHG